MLRSVFFRRLFIPFLALIVLATAGLGVFAAMRLRTTYLESRKQSLHAELQLAGNILNDDVVAGRIAQLQQKVEKIGKDVECRVTVIASDGKVLESKLSKSSGFKNLDKAALKALSACKFKPGTKDGVVAQTWTKVEYEWKL